MRKKLLAAFLSATLIISVCPITSTFAVQSVSQWATSDYDTANILGFIPEKLTYNNLQTNITREEFCSVALNIYKRLTGHSVSLTRQIYFTDALTAEVNTAYELGLISGRENGIFSPDDPVTRQEISRLFENILVACNTKIPELDSAQILNGFNDIDSLAAWAIPSMSLMVKYEIIRGADGSLCPAAQLSREQALALSARFYNAFHLPKSDDSTFTKPEFVIPFNGTAIDEAKNLIVGWTNKTKADYYTVYLYNLDQADDYYSFRQDTINTILLIPALKFNKGESYAIRVAAQYNDGEFTVYSDFQYVSVGEAFHPSITNKSDFSELNPSKTELTVNWKTYDTNQNCIIELYKDSKLVLSESFQWGKSYLLSGLVNGSTYKLCLFGADENGNKTLGFDYVEFFLPGKPILSAAETVSDNEKYQRIFGEGEITTEEQAITNMVTITIDVWNIDANGKKYASKRSLTVHKNISQDVENIFREIFNSPEQFPIKSIGGYAWRAPYAGRLSHHNYGTAIDINSDENYCIYKDGTTIGNYWKPGEDPYSISEDSNVVKIFAKYGFAWGGNAWSNPKDYMHFTYLGL